MKTRMLSLLIAAALAAGSAQASDKTPAPGTPQQQAARAEIDRLVKRIEELSRQLGDGQDVRVIVRHGQHGVGPRALEDFEDEDDDEDEDGDRRVVIKRMGPGGAPMAIPGEDGERKIRMERAGPGEGRWKSERLPGEERMFHQGPGLGIVLASNTAAGGVRIAAVTPDSPAMRAGIRSGDIVLQVNGKAIAGNGAAAVDNARALIGDLKQGQVVKLHYARQGKTYDASVKAEDIHRVFAYSRDGMAPKARMPGPDDEMHFRRGDMEGMLPPGVEMDIERIGPMRDCGKGKNKDKDCGLPVIYEAFRWQGLNLASIDTGLGRYFGTQNGVLVLSSGEDLKGLQSGDVIQRVGGVAVDSPRDVMRALRDKDSGSQLKLDLLRDRKPLAVAVTVPKSRPLPFITPPPPPPPPAPPAPPMAPRTPHAAPPAPPPPPGVPRAAVPPAPPAPPAPPTPPPRGGAAYYAPQAQVERVVVDADEDADIDEQVEIVVAPAR